jgi:hypothetical protein
MYSVSHIAINVPTARAKSGRIQHGEQMAVMPPGIDPGGVANAVPSVRIMTAKLSAIRLAAAALGTKLPVTFTVRVWVCEP